MGIEDGDIIDPHDMDPQTVLRFVKSVNGWPGKVIVIGCEPVDDRGLRHRPLARGRGGRRDAPSSSSPRRSRSCVEGARASCRSACTSSRIVATAERHADGRASRPCACASAAAPGRARLAQFCFGTSPASTVCEGATLELEIVPAVLRCSACAHEWEIESRPFWCPSCAGGDVRSPVRGEELEVESIEIEDNERSPHASHQVKVARGRARREQHDRAREPRRLRPRAA
jgi:hypothetical protein